MGMQLFFYYTWYRAGARLHVHTTSSADVLERLYLRLVLCGVNGHCTNDTWGLLFFVNNIGFYII